MGSPPGGASLIAVDHPHFHSHYRGPLLKFLTRMLGAIHSAEGRVDQPEAGIVEGYGRKGALVLVDY